LFATRGVLTCATEYAHDLPQPAHIQLTVRDLAASRAFYRKLLHETLGMAIQYDHPEVFYCIGGRTGVLIRSAPA
jgi:catechol 2,3-dioxygenase-like lactoylglutathione lyase family enzyme